TSQTANPRRVPRSRRVRTEWRTRYALRTSVERCIKRQKVDYKLETSHGRSSRHWNLRVYLIAMCQHADAWLEEAKKQKQLPAIQQWLNESVAA
ncbi:DDE transposase, partial [Paenibacillus validus]|nr:DDE transposase [Paenibacillus validus]